MKLRVVKFLVVPFLLSLVLASVVVIFSSNNIRRFLPPPLAPPEYSKVDQSKPVDAQTRTIALGGRTFQIPLKYIEVLNMRDAEQPGLLLKVIWPDMTSLFDLNNRQEYEQLRHAHRIGNI